MDIILAKLNLLTSAFLKSAPTGKHIDGAGLWFIKRPDGGAQWMLRVSLGGKRREMGLGGFPDVSLKEARELATDYRKMALCIVIQEWFGLSALRTDKTFDGHVCLV